MLDNDFKKLLNEARKLANKRVLNAYCISGQVACALMTVDGNIYTGISLTAKCALGNCAEVAAVLEALKHGETKIAKILAYSYHDCIYAMCGRCREYLRQIDEANLETVVLLDMDGTSCQLKELLPNVFVRRGTQ